MDEDASEKILARAEREIFIGFYSVRKLLATFKVSNNTKRFTQELMWYPAKSATKVDYFNRGDIDRHYDLNRATTETRDIGFLCNQVIHSFVFVFAIGDTGSIDGVFLASDTLRQKRVCFVPLDCVIRIFHLVGRDYPSKQSYVRDPQTGEWEARDDESEPGH